MRDIRVLANGGWICSYCWASNVCQFISATLVGTGEMWNFFHVGRDQSRCACLLAWVGSEQLKELAWILWAFCIPLLNLAVGCELTLRHLDSRGRWPCNQHLLLHSSWQPDGPCSLNSDSVQGSNEIFGSWACLNSLLCREFAFYKPYFFFGTALWPWNIFLYIERALFISWLWSSGHLNMHLDFHSWDSNPWFIF